MWLLTTSLGNAFYEMVKRSKNKHFSVAIYSSTWHTSTNAVRSWRSHSQYLLHFTSKVPPGEHVHVPFSTGLRGWRLSSHTQKNLSMLLAVAGSIFQKEIFDNILCVCCMAKQILRCWFATLTTEEIRDSLEVWRKTPYTTFSRSIILSCDMDACRLENDRSKL